MGSKKSDASRVVLFGRPMEEAPRDEPILGYDPEVSPPEAQFAVVQWAEWGGGSWDVIHDDEDYRWQDFSPTMWWHLPVVRL